MSDKLRHTCGCGRCHQPRRSFMARSIRIGSCIGLVLTIGGSLVWTAVDWVSDWRRGRVRFAVDGQDAV